MGADFGDLRVLHEAEFGAISQLVGLQGATEFVEIGNVKSGCKTRNIARAEIAIRLETPEWSRGEASNIQ
jgi:hypothetical protein